jgi:dephospho-CoA kinase
VKPLQIGITGGIGSGKSLVCRIFNCLGIPVYDADSRAKSLMVSDHVLMEGIRKEFGSESYDTVGNLNRQYLARIVFPDPDKLQRLNTLVHPRVALDYENWVTGYEGTVPYVIKEAALLFESGSSAQLDKVIVVSAPEDVRMKRVKARDAHRDEKQIRDIMAKQWPEEEKLKRADYIIYNDESVLLIPQVIALHQEFSTFVN